MQRSIISPVTSVPRVEALSLLWQRIVRVTTLRLYLGRMKVRIAKLFTAAATSVALVASPAVAASQGSAKSAASTVGARAGAMSDADEELFRGRRRGGALVFILIAVVIAVGIYIIIDDKDNERPVSA